MSWKSIVITGLLCVVASPVLAVPTTNAKLLGLDTAGNWVWQVNVVPDAALFSNNPPNGTGGSVALEIGATASGRNLVSAAANTTNFTANNPGVAPAAFTFWTAADTGVKSNVATNQLFAALGSTYFTTGGDKEAFRVHTQRPAGANLATTLTLSGSYGGNGRLAQAGQNFDSVTGANVKTVLPGNANLSPLVDVGDLAILAANYEVGTGKRWQDADFTGDGLVNVGDLAVLAANFDDPDVNWATAGAVNIPTTPGAGGGSIAAGVPEPSTIIMLLVGCLSALATRRGR